MATKSPKFYVVWKGKKPGIYKTWASCKASIDGYKGALYKSFPTFAAAQKAYNGNYEDFKGKSAKPRVLSEADKLKYGTPNFNSISVDAASSGNPGKMEYRGVDTKTKKQLFHQGPFLQGTNNIGEFLALVHGLAFLKKHNSDRIIYTDSRIAMGWVRKKKCNTKLSLNAKNKNVFELVKRAEHWLKTNSYNTPVVKWETKAWGEIPADFGRK
ncbi:MULTISPECIES: ribonuclease H family protein [Croceibacter]|jgi:ribonuclease HI|uniref:ribonuclease H family protein n=1 Tax=Croceibacter TaxID=216431 RepID=UPI000C65D59E|nr:MULTISPECIES: ribonuclease H family protein [Croceibacter]MBG25245.1 ribonuclease H [Croceibacter sp.]|tara:strand:- start:4716 stop:5354 length:639 start_codon:yes stop_codon:yes gene_type:complete